MTMEKTRKQKKSNAKPKQLPLSLKADGPFAKAAGRASLLWLTSIIYHALDFLEKRALLHMANVLNI